MGKSMLVEQRENKTLLTADYVRDAITQIFFPALKLNPRLVTYTEPLGMPPEQRQKYEAELRSGKKPYPRVYLRRSPDEKIFFVGSVVKDRTRPADHILEPIIYEPLESLDLKESRFIPEHNLIALVGYPYPTVGLPPYPVPLLDGWRKPGETQDSLLERLRPGLRRVVLRDGAAYVEGRYYWDIGERVGEWLDFHFGAGPPRGGPDADRGRRLLAKFAAAYYVKARFDHPDQFREIDLAPSLPYSASTDEPEELARRLAYAIERSRPPLHGRPLEFFFEDFAGAMLRALLKMPPEERVRRLRRLDWRAVGENLQRGAVAVTLSPLGPGRRLLYEVFLRLERLMAGARRKTRKAKKHSQKFFGLPE